MGRPIGLNVNRFDELIENGYFYIDKTMFIKYVKNTRDVIHEMN